MVQMSDFLFGGSKKKSSSNNKNERPFERLLNFHGGFK